MNDEELDAYAVHVNQMERDRQQQQADLAVAKEGTRTARWQSIATVFGALAAAGAVVGVAVVIWFGVRGPSATDLIRQEDRQRCIEAGGTYTFVDATDDVQTCTMPGGSTR